MLAICTYEVIHMWFKIYELNQHHFQIITTKLQLMYSSGITKEMDSWLGCKFGYKINSLISMPDSKKILYTLACKQPLCHSSEGFQPMNGLVLPGAIMTAIMIMTSPKRMRAHHFHHRFLISPFKKSLRGMSWGGFCEWHFLYDSRRRRSLGRIEVCVEEHPGLTQFFDTS